jgi:hypothetical protein
MPFSSINYISIIYIFNILLIVNRGSMEKNARKNGGGGVALPCFFFQLQYNCHSNNGLHVTKTKNLKEILKYINIPICVT